MFIVVNSCIQKVMSEITRVIIGVITEVIGKTLHCDRKQRTWFLYGVVPSQVAEK